MDSNQPSNRINTIEAKWNLEETRKLIEMVKKNPCLYHLADKNLKNLKFTENIWSNIDLQLRKPPGSSKDRWGSLRLTFRREYIAIERATNENTIKRSTWKLYNQMSFIGPHLYRRGPTLAECVSNAYKSLQSSSQLNDENTNNSDSYVDVLEVRGNIDQSTNGMDESVTIQYLVEEESPDPFRSREVHQLNAMSTPKGFLKPTSVGPMIKNEMLSQNNFAFRGVKVRKLSTQNTKTVEANTYNEQIQPLSTSEINRMNVSVACKNIKSSYTVSTAEQQQCAMKERAENLAFCQCNADCDAMFLQTLLPEMKLLSKQKKLQFKIHIQQTLNNLLYSSSS